MDRLPTELMTGVCRFLDTSSLQAFRLTCRAFADVGEGCLFDNFEFRLYSDHRRLYQLEQLAAKPSIAARLTCLSFESGVPLEYADYRYWQAQVYQAKTTAWERSQACQGASRAAHQHFHEMLQARFTADLQRRYDAYRWHLDQQAASVADERVQHGLVRSMTTLHAACPRLRFKVVMREPQIEIDVLERFDADGYALNLPHHDDQRRRVANRRHHCLRHFNNFLRAACASPCPVEELIAVDLPHEFLTALRVGGADTMQMVLQTVKRFEVTISTLPHSDWLSRSTAADRFFVGRNVAARTFVQSLAHAPALDTLKLEFPRGVEAQWSHELLDRTHMDQLPRVWLAHLKSLSLCHVRCAWPDLRAFLDQGRKLTRLELATCRLDTGSMIDLLHYVSQRRLVHAQVSGTWYVEEDRGEWHAHSAADFTDCLAATSYEGPFLHAGLRSQVEHFLRHGGLCPLRQYATESQTQRQWEVLGDTTWHYLPTRGPLEH